MAHHQLITAWQAGREEVRAYLADRAARGDIYWGCQPLADNSFAAACYNQNTMQDLDLSNIARADRPDCETWGLTPTEWAYQIGQAYEALSWDREHPELREG